MEKIFGFIGAGNMGGALARSAARTVPGKQILIANRTAAKAEALAAELGACASDNITAAQRADYIILGVKPQMFPELTAELAPVLAARQSPFVLVTMAAGITIERLRALLHGDWPVIRIMPNTPCSVGRGVILYTAEGVEDADVRAFLAAMDGAGELIELPETLFDAGSAVSGCGPAFVDLFIEAMADAAKAVSDARSGRMAYINVMNRLSVDCDCDGTPDEPDMHDIGVLASTDPVALDQACLDLVWKAPDSAKLKERVTSRNGFHTLEAADKVGLGSRKYELVVID